MRIVFAIVIATVLGLGLWSGLALNERIVNDTLVEGLALCILAPFALVLLIISLIKLLRKRKLGLGIKRALLVWCALASGLFVSSITSKSVNWYEVSSARAYAIKAVPFLDEIKANEGSYPATLPVSSLGRPPLLLQTSYAYSSDGKEFRFEYQDPSEYNLRNIHEFDSTDRNWKDYEDSDD